MTVLSSTYVVTLQRHVNFARVLNSFFEIGLEINNTDHLADPLFGDFILFFSSSQGWSLRQRACPPRAF